MELRIVNTIVGIILWIRLRLTLGIWLVELDIRWDYIVLQRQDPFNETGKSRCTLRVAYIGFHLIAWSINNSGSYLSLVSLTEPMYTPWEPKIFPIAFVSKGSPVGVPVPWH